MLRKIFDAIKQLNNPADLIVAAACLLIIAGALLVIVRAEYLALRPAEPEKSTLFPLLNREKIRQAEELLSHYRLPAVKPDDQSASSSVQPNLTEEAVVVEVVNSSGRAGAGSAMKTFLENKGYQVLPAKTGEEIADETTVQFKEKINPYQVEALLSAVQEKYQVSKATALADESGADAVVILGKNMIK